MTIQTYNFIHPARSGLLHNQHIITHSTASLNTYTPSVSSHSVSHNPLCLVSAGHACHAKLKADDGRLLFRQLAVERPFQLSVALLPALGAAAALYCPLRVGALRGLLAHFVLFILLFLPLRVFAVDRRPQNEGVGTRRERVGVGMLVSGGRRRGGVGRHDGLHAELLQPLDGEKIIPQSDVLISLGG